MHTQSFADYVVMGKFGLCLKLICEMKVLELLDCLENLHILSLIPKEGACKFSKQSDNSNIFISHISFRYKSNFPITIS